MRRIININDGWKFVKEDVGAEQAVSAPVFVCFDVAAFIVYG